MILIAYRHGLRASEVVGLRWDTGGREPPTQRVDEFLGLIGRRGGKDRAASVLAAYLAACIDWSDALSPGERPVVLCIGPDQRQSKIRDYIEGAFQSSPVLSAMVKNTTDETLELVNGVCVDVRAASFRRLRGVTAVACIATESAFWYDETASASGSTDAAILEAVRPAFGHHRRTVDPDHDPFSQGRRDLCPVARLLRPLWPRPAHSGCDWPEPSL